MCKKRKKSVRISGNGSFIVLNIILLLILAGSIVFSVADVVFGVITWPNNYVEVIGVSTQIITAVASLVVSIVGIAISLQNEEFFGVKITKLYSLRVTKHYSIVAIILISISLCIINLVCYMIGLIVGALGSAVVMLLFLVRVICTEVPIMAKDEKSILRILKDNLVQCYLKKSEVPKDLKDAIRFLSYRKNIKTLYIEFKDAKDDNFNNYLILKLLEFQHDLAFDLKDQYEEKDQRIIADCLMENILDVIFRHVDLSDEQYAEIIKNKHLLTRVLFRINEIPCTQNILLNRISGLFQCLTFKSATQEKITEFLSTILIILVTETVKDGDFGVIKGIRRQLSMSDYCLKESTPALDLFAVLSMHLFYLCHSEKDTPQAIKDSILEFINEQSHIEENTRIVSWKQLFATASSAFNVDYDNFISLSLKHEHNLEYWLYGVGAKWVVLDSGYLAEWYLTHLLNAHSRYVFNYTEFIARYPDIKERLKAFGEKCFDENGQFAPTERMNAVVSFYDEKSSHFQHFCIIENREHTLFTTINQIKLETLRNDVALAMKVDEERLAQKIRNGIEEALRGEWGYDSQLTIEGEERYFAVLFEKFPEAINFEDSFVDFGRRSVLHDIEQATPKTIIYNNDSFEESIRRTLSKKLKYCTKDAKTTIPQWFIKDPELQQLYMNVCNPLEEFKSKLLSYITLVVDEGFAFNCEVCRVFFRPLSEEELAKQVAKHQRADGQYVFNGTFMPQEEISKIVRSKYSVLMMTIRYTITSTEDSVFELRPYHDGPEE